MYKTSTIKKIIISLFLFAFFLTPAIASDKPEIFVQMGHTSSVTSVAFSPDGKYLASGSNDKSVKIWEVSTGREIRTLRLKDGIDKHNSVKLSPDGKLLASVDRERLKGFIRLWDIFTGRELKKFPIIISEKLKEDGFMRSDAVAVTFSPDGKSLIVAVTIHSYKKGEAAKSMINLWDIKTRKLNKTIPVHAGQISDMALSPDGKYVLLIRYFDNTVSLLDLTTGKEMRKFAGHSKNVHYVAISPDGKYLASGAEDKTIILWDIETGKKIKAFTNNERYERFSIAFSPDGKRLIVSGLLEMELLDVSTGRLIATLEGVFRTSSVVFSPDGRYAVVLEQGTYKIIDIKNKREISTLKTPSNFYMDAAAFSPDGRYVAGKNAAMADTFFTLWDVSTGKVIRTFSGHFNLVGPILFTADGSRILSGSADGTLKLWKTETGRAIKTFYDVHVNPGIEAIDISSDGRYAASGDEDGNIKLLEIDTGREINTFKGHTDSVESVLFSFDGAHLLSGSRDGTTRLWDISSGKEIAQFVRFTDGEWIVITPEGYFNASPNGAKHLNVRVGNNVYSIDNFYEKFFNPVYVASVLQGKKVEAVADIRKGILTPPDVRITSPEPNATFNTDTISITVSAKDTGGGIDEIRLYHNDKAIGEDHRAVKIVPKPVPAGSKQGGNETIKTYTVSLVGGLNTFRAVGFSKDRTESNPYELIVKLTAPSKDVSLYVLAVGINKYKNPALNLNYAEPDAKGITGFFRQKGKGLFKKVEIIEIYNEQATKGNIISKLNQLRAAHPQDAVLIYLAGHGESISDRWYFIPHELTYPERENEVKAKGISSDELSEHIKNIKAQKMLMLIDACKAGAVLIAFRGFEDRKALSQLSRSTGVHIIAASTKDQFAAEVKDLGHGVFTYTLLEGLKGKAAGGTETVTVRKLMGYIEEKLPDITRKYKQEAQFPVVDSKGMDFPLVLTK